MSDFQPGEKIEVELKLHKEWKNRKATSTWLPAVFLRYSNSERAFVEVVTKLGKEKKTWAVSKIRRADKGE